MSVAALSRCKPLLGTYVEVSLQAEISQRDLIELSHQAFDAINNIHQKMSFHEPTSELSRINRLASKEVVPISPEMFAVLKEAIFLSKASKGLYDISVAGRLVKDKALPDPQLILDNSACWRDIELTDHSIYFHKPLLIDLGGIAKGFAVDKAIACLEDKVEATINAGGDLFMTHWQGQSSFVRQASLAREIPMQAPALATSGNYFLDTHLSVIYPPENPRPKESMNSYCVFADTCMRADALTKIAYLDPTAGMLIRELGATALEIDPEGTIRIL